MPKKSGTTKKSTSLSKRDEEIVGKLVKNFVSLQKVLTNLSVKLDGLSDQITKLLNLFEISAKSFVKKYEEEGLQASKIDKKFVEQLDKLLDQNKTIAKGLLIIEERLRDKGSEGPTYRGNIRPRPLPRI